jgi:Gly-Xaa carboxypeptidase
MPKNLRKLIRKSTTSNAAMKKLTQLISKDNMFKNLIGTTQAIDMINGGIKANALPEQAAAIVNHRVSVARLGYFYDVQKLTYIVFSTVEETRNRDIQLLTSLANQFNLSFDAFGVIIREEGSKGSLTLGDPFHDSLEPAPISPLDAAPYRLLSGTIKAAFNSHHNLAGADNIIVTPGTMSGNTGQSLTIYKRR